jgi:hypothetical protein
MMQGQLVKALLLMLETFTEKPVLAGSRGTALARWRGRVRSLRGRKMIRIC